MFLPTYINWFWHMVWIKILISSSLMTQVTFLLSWDKNYFNWFYSKQDSVYFLQEFCKKQKIRIKYLCHV